MEEWKTYKVGDLCMTNVSQYSPLDEWKEVLYLDTGNITNNTIGTLQIINLSDNELPSRARRKVQDNDIIFSTVRPNQHHFGILKSPKSNMLVSTGFVVLTPIQEIVNPGFLYYTLTQERIVNLLHSIAEQSVSAYPSIKAKDIEDLEIEMPPIKVQKQIADILATLDAKIELNRRINDNLVRLVS